MDDWFRLAAIRSTPARPVGRLMRLRGRWPRAGQHRLSTFRPRDLMTEAVSAIIAKPGRAVITMLGTVLGVGTLVAVLGLTSTIQGQIGARFDALAAKTVVVQDGRSSSTYLPFPFTPEGVSNVKKLNGVTDAGYSWRLPSTGVSIAGVPTISKAAPLSVYAVSPGVWSINRPNLILGRTFDDFHERTRTNVVVLGEAAAKQLGISTLETQPAVLLNSQPYVVIGIVSTMPSHPEMLLGAMIPVSVAIGHWGPPTEKILATMTVQTDPGAASQVAAEIPYAISPQDVSAVKSIPPADPRSLRDAVTGDLAGLFLALAALCLVIGAVGIANTTLVAVMERTGEIGLRRAVGARRRHIGVQIVTESAALGVIGGVVGSSLGMIAIVCISWIQSWGPVLEPWLVVIAPALGTASGVLAGLYPAWRATKIEPTEALRR